MAKSYPLRLPPHLDLEARERCESLGISLNALIAVALDAYLSRGGAKRTAPRKSPAAPAPKPAAKSFEPYHPDPENWRNFDNPDSWPFADPDWDSGLEEPDEDDPDSPTWTKYLAEVDRLYWQTHDRPKR